MVLRHSFLLFIVSFVLAPHGSATLGPTVSGPEIVSAPYALRLDPGPVTEGNWTIDWGDGSHPSVLPVSAKTAAHDFAAKGSYQISAVLRDGTGILVDSQYSYHDLVLKTTPSVHYHFDTARGSGNIGPAVMPLGTVSTVASFSGSTGDAVRLEGRGCLVAPELKMENADFFGLEFWLRPADLSVRQMIFAGVSPAVGNVRVYIENKNLCFELAGSGVIKSVPLGDVVDAGRWHQFAISYERSPYFKESNTLRFYRDGFLLKEDSYTAAQALPVSFTGAVIGAHNTGTIDRPSITYPLRGDIDEIVLHPIGVFPGAFLERYRAATANRSSFRVTVGASGAAPFVVHPPVIVREIIVGLDSNPAADNAPRIRDALHAAEPGTRIKLVDAATGKGGGVYYLRSAQNGPHVGRLITMQSKTDVELDGNGVTLLMINHLTRFIEILHSTRVTVKNLAMDIDQNTWRPGAYAQVLKVDPAAGKIDIRWVKGAAWTPDVVPSDLNLWRWRHVNGVTRRNVSGVREWSLTAKTPDRHDRSKWTLTLNPSKHPSNSGIWAEFTALQKARDLIQVNNSRFIGSAVYTEGGSHLTFDRFSIYGFAGMGIICEKSDYVKVSNSKIGLPPGLSALDRPFSTGSDGIHFHNSRNGRLLIENTDIGMTDDDPISIKDEVSVNVEKVAANQLKCPWLQTDLIELRQFDLRPFDPPFTAKVTHYDSSARVATLDRDIPGTNGAKFHLLKRYQYSGNYILRGNNIHDLNGRMMVYTGDGLVTNNRFGDLMFHVGFSAIYFEGSGHPYNIAVTNNLFTSRGRSDIQIWGPATPSLIEDVNFTNNSFLGTWWILANSKRPTMVNNYSEAVKLGGDANRGIFHLIQSTDATIIGNIHYNPVATSFATKDAHSSFIEGANELIPHRATAADVLVDNTRATYVGAWHTSFANTGQFYGGNYLWSVLPDATATFTPAIPAAGTYRVYAMWSDGAEHGRTVPYTITHADGVATVSVSQRTGGGLWVYLGTYPFSAGTNGRVQVATNGANGRVIADAVRFQQ